jgi:hypothetical protein
MSNNILFRSFLFAVAMSMGLCACEKDEDESTDGTGKGVDLNRDLVLHYTFDEGSSSGVTQIVTDRSGKGHNGICEGQAEFVADPSGYSLRLRKGDFVNIPTAAFSDSTNATVSIWLKDFGQGAIFTSENGSTMVTPSLYITNDDVMAYEYGNSPGFNWSTVWFSNQLTSYQGSGWHHLVVATSGSRRECLFYIDGIHVDTKEGGQSACNANKMMIGGNGSGFLDFWSDPMFVDNVRVYQRCLNPKEVSEIYSKEKK